VARKASRSGLAEGVAPLHPQDDLGEAIERILEADREALLIVDADGRLVGWIEHRDLLRAYAVRRRADTVPEWKRQGSLPETAGGGS
jgi:CBS domain-containing protein